MHACMHVWEGGEGGRQQEILGRGRGSGGSGGGGRDHVGGVLAAVVAAVCSCACSCSICCVVNTQFRSIYIIFYLYTLPDAF